MNKSQSYSQSHKKRKAAGYRKFMKTSKGRKIIKTRRRKGRKIL